MGEISHIYVFGDETFDYSKGLSDLVHQNSDPLVVHFFETTYYALRVEIGHLPKRQRKVLLRFSNFAELAAQSLAGSLHPGLDLALACAYQLARFISEYGQEWSYPKAANSQVIGLCSGALAAAAVCSSTTFSNLLAPAIQSVVVAFRIGMRSAEACLTISLSKGFDDDWSMLVPRLTVEEANQAIKEFSRTARLPVTTQPFVGVVSDSGVAINGPPSVLLSMRSGPYLASPHTAPLGIKTPYHAPHLFSKEDVDSILSTTAADQWAAHFTTIPVISSATGDTIWSGDFRSLLRAAVEDILRKPLRWDRVTQRLRFIASSARGMPLVVHQIGVAADGGIRTALKQGGCDAPLVLDQSRSLPHPDSLRSSNSKSQAIAEKLSRHRPNGRPDKSKIAIVSSSGRFPSADDLSSFWNLLYEGRDVHKVVPPLHWDAKTHVDPTGKKKNTNATPFGCWLDNPELFDAKFFNISPREAPQVDPAQRIALLTAYEAIEQAGIVPGATPSTQKDRAGVFYGVTSNDWMETNSAQDIDAYHIPGGNRAFIPGRINCFFNFSGPSYSVDRACSSSLASIHVACNAIWRGEIDTAIAGGTNIITNPDFTAGLDRGHFLSRTGNCKTFDDDADGYCRGEGVGTVILKRLEDAVYDGDPIQAIVSGAYTNHSAEAESITRPLVAAQKDIFRKILNTAGVDPYDIGYIEMHGTSTQAGDGAEMRSVVETFAPEDARRKRNDRQNLYIGSAKANIGHGEAASGVSSLIKVLLMMKKNIIPPHCGIKTKINHTFPKNLGDRRVFIADKAVQWKRPDEGVRKVFINNFSAAGGNTALLLEDAPIGEFEQRNDCRSTHVVAVSAKCFKSLEGNLATLVAFLDNARPDELPQLSWTTTARRMHHRHRVMVHGNDIQAVKANLRHALGTKQGEKHPASAPKVVFAFTGQGSAYLGMAKEIYEGYSSFRRDVDRFDMMATSLGFPHFKFFFTASEGESFEPTPLVSQLAIVCLEMALARMWISWGIVPHSVVGHSLGEYAALNIAGVLSDSDTIYLVGKRAQLLQEHCLPGTHSMLAMKANLEVDLATIKKTLKGKKYEFACINSPEESVISGTKEVIQDALKLLATLNIKASVLNVPYAFHSAQVEPILLEFEQTAQAVSFHAPGIPVLNPLDGSVIREDGVLGPNYLSQHCRRPVNMLGAINAAQQSNTITEKSFFLEIGPHPVVSGMVKATLPQANALPSLRRKTDTWQVLAQTISKLYMAGTDIQWRGFHRDFQSSQKVLQLPNYRWDLKAYWMQYVNDWSLRKGNPPLTQIGPSQEAAQAEPTIPRIEKPTIPRIESTTIHTVVEETVSGNQGLLVLESDISRPDLNPLVQGHKVNGVPLCTPSVYADIALSTGYYLRQRFWSHLKDHGVVVADMEIEKALIAAPRGAQLLRTFIEMDKNETRAKLVFCTVDTSGQKKAQHAKCSVRFSGPSEVQEIQHRVPKIRARIGKMRDMLEEKKTYVFNKPMIYKMVATLADFDPNYRALDEIVLDSSAMEASSVANFSGIKTDGKFFTNPAYIDALSQSAGFVMNANDKSNLDLEVFVNHGWSSFQLFEDLSPNKHYETHVAMLEFSGKLWKGDILVLDGDKVVVIFEGIALQGVARRLLHYILSTESATQSGTKNHKEPSTSAKPAADTSRRTQEDKPPPVRPKTPSASLAKPIPSSTPVASKAELSEPKRQPSAAEQKPAAVNAESAGLFKRALEVISEESGIDSEELEDDTILSDVGIDSLLGLVIASRFRDELAMDIDAATLHGFDTIKGLKNFLAGTHDDSAKDNTAEANLISALEVKADYQGPNELPVVTAISGPIENECDPPETPALEGGGANAEGQFTQILQIISEESGIDIEEFTDDAVFTDIGIDSLLSMMITSRLRDELDVKAGTEANLFLCCNTLRDLRLLLTPPGESKARETLGVNPSSIIKESMTLASSNSSSISLSSAATESEHRVFDDKAENSDTSSSSEEPFTKISKLTAQPRRATSVILQGRPWICSKTLFLFPDGAGSASSRRQPNGPYNFGGWSAGGILAYRAAQILIQEGEQVENLVLMDSPVPKGLDRLPQRFYDHLTSIGIFGKAMPGPSLSPPAHLFAHFNATIEVLHGYHAKPLPSTQLEKATIVWATDCVIDGVKLPKLPPGPDDTEGMKFLTEKRTDFTAAGWETLFPGTRVDVTRVEGAHHFSMMQHMPQAQILAEIVRSAVSL